MFEDSIVFGLHNLDLSKLKDVQSYILKNLKSNELVWQDEASIKSCCKDVLKVAIDCLSLNHSLYAAFELSIFGEKSDLWILKNGEVSIGLVEIKRPYEKDTNGSYNRLLL